MLGLIVLGSATFALGFDLFLEPNLINIGGMTGAAMLIRSVLGFGSVGIITAILNVPLFLLGFRYLGRRFFLGSVCGMLMVSVFLEMFSVIPVPQTEILLGVLYGGVLTGAGLGLVFLSGASTGGMDIVASLLRRKFRELPLGKLMLMLDVLVVALTGVVYHDVSKALYSAVTLYVSSMVLDAVLYGLDYSTVALIISSNYREIADAIDRELERGVTMLDGRGGYTGVERTVLLVAVRKRQSAQLKQLCQRIDPDAFVILQQAHQVLGNGFGRYTDSL